MQPEPAGKSLADIIAETKTIGKSILDTGYDRDTFYQIITEACGTPKFHTLKNAADAQKALDAVMKIYETLRQTIVCGGTT